MTTRDALVSAIAVAMLGCGSVSNAGGGDGGSGPIDAPPDEALGTIAFTTASSSVSEFPPTPTTVTITLTREGRDLTAAATATVTIATGTTAAPGVHYTLEGDSTLGTTGSHVFTFPPQAAGVTSQQISFTVTPKYARRPMGTQTTLLLEVTAATGAAVSSPRPQHTVTFTGAGDRAANGAAIPEFVAPGGLSGQGAACEPFIASNVLGTPQPGSGGLTPCGSYDLDLTMHADYARCNLDMKNTTSTYGGGVGNVLNTVQRARMFVNEDVVMTNTYFGGNSMRYAQHQNDAFIMKFRTGGAGDYPPNASLPTGAIGALQFTWVEQLDRGQSGFRFAALSTIPCDFDYTKYGVDRCFVDLTIQGGGNIYAQIVPEGVNAAPGYCQLRPNTTYYLSTRWEDPRTVQTRGLIACRPVPGTATGQYCGTNFDFR